MRAEDTAPAAEEVRIRLLRAAGSSRRFKMACALSEGVRELSRAGIRSRHPEYSDEDVELAMRRVLLGEELFQAVWPNAPLRAP